MLNQQRKQFLIHQLQLHGQVIAKQIAQELEVSEDTIRRDLRELAKEGLLQRVHGGALPISPALSSFQERQQIAMDAKQQMAQAAIELMQAGQIIFLDGGTSTEQIAKQLPPKLALTIITHSPSIALALVEHPRAEVILLGGKLFKHSIVTVGAMALEALQTLNIDLYFMGVTGIHPEFGLTTGDLEEAGMKRAISKRSAETYVLASPEKLGKVSTYGILPLTEISGLILPQAIEDTQLSAYQLPSLTLIKA
ncbi:MAG TPA: DeoR/GlpR family DNA-binding transcription regulator [Thiolinea sp.]|nr:DeoR/GlpR family DNA-binding transcription regulator [Thiolinea sp.]